MTADDGDEQMARERWTLRLLARNQDTAQARASAQRHLERLGELIKTQWAQTTTTRTNEG